MMLWGRRFKDVGKHMKSSGFFGCDPGETNIIQRHSIEVTIPAVYTLHDLYTYNPPVDGE